jgi:hypothetical protein
MAHSRRAISFDIPGVLKLFRQLHCLKDVQVSGNHQPPPKVLFVEASKIMMMFLISKIGPFPNAATGIKIEGINELD